MAPKERLDKLLVKRGLAETQEAAQKMILAGSIRVNSVLIDKPGTQVVAEAQLEVIGKRNHVGRGAEKLIGALEKFPVSVSNRICADVGSSTGGFTEILLERGALKVFAIDVGYGELDWKLRKDRRVVVMERTNARHLNELPEKIDLVTMDLSFISILKVLPVVKNWLKESADLILLVKPQFEASPEEVGEGGIVRDGNVHRSVLEKVVKGIEQLGCNIYGLCESPIRGGDGNREFFVWVKTDRLTDLEVVTSDVIERVVEGASGH